MYDVICSELQFKLDQCDRVTIMDNVLRDQTACRTKIGISLLDSSPSSLKHPENANKNNNINLIK